jgi:anti-sigma factor RsiW
MSHQPFETWILDPDTISAEDRRSLQAHLAECPQCQRLEQDWKAVHQQLRARTMVAPAPGFTRRWQAGLAERRARAQRRQAWKIFGFLSGGALFILLLLAGYMIATTSPTDWLMGLVRIFASSRQLIDVSTLAVQSWLTTTPLALNIALWIYLTVTLCLLSFVWLLIVWRTKTVGVTQQ